MLRAPRLKASDIATALGGRRAGKGFIARCPAHADRTPSLSIEDSADGADGSVLIYCHAGCSQKAVIAALTGRGLWSQQRHSGRLRALRTGRDLDASENDDRSRREHALKIWGEAQPAGGTLVETYLRTRGITLPPPSALRFHERLWHQPSQSARPAMVALITNGLTGDPISIHRTFLTSDGFGKAPVEPSKMMLGAVKGGVIRLAEVIDHVAIGEGIETCLSVQQACAVPTWAALSAVGIRALNLPPGISDLTIIADGDRTGDAAAQAAAKRLRLAVRAVRIVRAPKGLDFNDLLNAHRTPETRDD
jgi:putative DNA primase/helicase